MENLKVYASPLPFSNKQVVFDFQTGSTLEQIVSKIVPDHAKMVMTVTINGENINRHHWRLVKPKAGTLINLRAVPKGGKGKNPLATVLSLALLVAAPYMGAYMATSVIGFQSAGFWMGSQLITWGRVLGAGIGVVGSLLINAIAPPPRPSTAGLANNPAESPTLFIEGAQNGLNPFGVVPICLGTNRMVPPMAGKPFTETAGRDNYVRQIFCWGVGNQVSVSDLKIGDEPLTNFTDYELEHRLNGDLNAGLNLYPNDPYQEDMNVLLEQANGYTTRTTQAATDEVIVDVTFPNGLTRISSSTGKKLTYTVQLELQYALSGTSPQVWTPTTSGYTSFGSFSDTVDACTPTTTIENISGTDYYVGYRQDLVIIDNYSGAISILKGADVAATNDPDPPKVPLNSIRLASALVRTRADVNTGTTTTEIVTFSDDRQATLYGTTFQNSSSFVPSNTGTTVNVTSGSMLVDNLTINGAQAEALRISQRIKFPTAGTYDIRIKRVTADTNNDRILDKVYLTALKSFAYRNPVTQDNVNGTAIRIKATGQLNGSISQFNGIVSSVVPDYDEGTGTWIDRATSNPASLYRFVLQGCGNSRAIADAKINLTDLEAWHTYCKDQGYSYNRVIDYDTSVEEVLRDIAAAGSASPTIVDGKRTVVVDRVKSDIVQLITPRNSWDYSGEMQYPELPHAFRVQFRNADKGYLQDERVVYDDGYNEGNATIFETLELQSCTNADLAYKAARRHIATARLRPEAHTFMMDIENLVALRGDRVKLAHDVPLVGVGDGRIKSVTMSGGSPNLVTGITLDDTIAIPSTAVFYARIRLDDGSTLYKQLNTTIGETKTLTFTTPFTRPTTGSPATNLLNAGDLVYVVEIDKELDLIIHKIEPQNDLTARITAVNYAPEIFNAELGAIPAFESNVTTPLEFTRPTAPVLVKVQSDEDVMLLNSDGSLLTRAIFTLENVNDGAIEPIVLYRLTGTTEFHAANVLERAVDRVVITGLDDGSNYDFQIRYKRLTSNAISLPLEINNYTFIGASGVPDDVTGFEATIAGNTALLAWDANSEIDIDHYEIRHKNVYTGATWGTAQVIEATVYENRLVTPFQGGTYLVKAVDRLGNESANAALVVTYNVDTTQNVVQTLTEHPSFSGTKTNTMVSGSALVLTDTSLTDGYYYFNNSIDLGSAMTSTLTATVTAGGAFVNDVFDIVDIFAETDIYGAGSNDLFAETDIFAMPDVFGIDTSSWSVELQIRTTNDNPSGSPVTWSSWATFNTGSYTFRAAQFRLKLTSLVTNVSPSVTELSVIVDMPDRIERGENLTVTGAGYTVTYPDAFAASPAVGITLQNAAVDDRIEFTSKNASGFTFKVYNGTSAGYVTRTFDYIASGYGRV